MIDIDKDEQIICEVRKHPFIIISELAGIVFFAILPGILFIFLVGLGVKVSFVTNFGNLFLFFYGIWLLISWLMAAILWTKYFLHVWVVTSKKILDIEQVGLFSRKVGILHLDKIQDITVSVAGIIPTMLKYGDVVVQTASAQGNFVVDGIPNPKLLHNKINEAVKNYKQENK